MDPSPTNSKVHNEEVPSSNQEDTTHLEQHCECSEPALSTLAEMTPALPQHSSPTSEPTNTCSNDIQDGDDMLLDRVIPRRQRRRRGRLHHHMMLFLAMSSACGSLATAAASHPPGTTPCNSDDYGGGDTTCLTEVGLGSQCLDGLCSNPFVSGCLRALLGHDTQKPQGTKDGEPIASPQVDDPTRTLRVCNSQDTKETIDNQLCMVNPFDYMEIRILTGNWESSLLTAWAMQIVLSEWMQVPTSIESSSPDRQANFYHPTNQFEYGAIAYDYEALEVAHQVGDCTKRYDDKTAINEDKFVELEGDQTIDDYQNEEEEPYISCAHVMPELWNGQSENLWSLTRRRIIEAPEGNGVVGKLTWYVPKYVAEQRPELAHYSGWARNRTAIASDFLRPLTWKEYCLLVSPSQCEVADDYASRPPSSESSEEGMYYDTPGNGQGFKGYFYEGDPYRNCTAYPNNCTGDFVDFPCDWSSFAVPQIHHLGIALESHGSHSVNQAYSYGEKLQIWQAANATGQFVVMNWYTPDPTYQWYRGTEAEFHEVQLPPPSPECVEHRVTVEERCSEDPTERVGSPAGACGAEVQTLEKVVVNNLYHTIYNLQKKNDHHSIRGGKRRATMEEVDEKEGDATRSPAYEGVKNFHLSEFDIGRMFEDWRDRLRQRGHDGFSTWEGTTGADPRAVVCQWVADNAEHLQTFVPFTYPRMLEEDDPYDNMAISWVALGFALFVTTCILSMGVVTYILREREAFKAAQLPFLYMVLLGLLAISTGGIVYSLAPENETCVARIWLINMGYTLEMSPLIVKIGAISKMLSMAKKMKRVTISRQKLFGVVGGICLLVASYLTAWTLLDPPSKGSQLTLQLDDVDYDEDDQGQDTSRAWWQAKPTPISVSYYCRSSGSAAWFTMGLVWQCLLLLSAAVLAMQTRRIQRRWNESRSLAIMVYTQGGFVVLRFLMWLLEEPSGVSVQILDVLRSFAFSLDAFLALLIYFGSKLVNVYQGSTGTSSGGGLSSRRDTFSGESPEFFSSPPAVRSSLENCKSVSDYFRAIGSEPPSLFSLGPSSRLLAGTSSRLLTGTSSRLLTATGTSSRFLGDPTLNGGLIGTSAKAGDIVVSKASSRRLAIAPMVVEESETSALICPRCGERYDDSTTPPRGGSFRSKDDNDIPTAVQTTDLLRPLSEESDEVSNIKGPEPQEDVSTLVTHEEEEEEEDSHTS